MNDRVKESSPTRVSLTPAQVQTVLSILLPIQAPFFTHSFYDMTDSMDMTGVSSITKQHKEVRSQSGPR